MTGGIQSFELKHKKLWNSEKKRGDMQALQKLDRQYKSKLLYDKCIYEQPIYSGMY